MTLKDYTDEELKAELRRRVDARLAQRKAERDAKRQCKKCIHFGTVDYHGNPIEQDAGRRWYGSANCPFAPNKKNKTYKIKTYRCLTGYEEACEHYKPKEP